MIIDSHTHLGRYDEWIVRPEMIIQEMDKAYIDYAFVFAHEHRLPQRGISTEELIKITKEYPRLFAIGTANPTIKGKFDLSKKRINFLRGILKDRLIFGIKFYVGYEHFWPTDKRLYPLYEVLNEEFLPVIFHSGFFWDPERKGLLKYAHPLPIDEIAVKFPQLKIIIAHLGNPHIEECGELMEHNPNVWSDVSGYFTEFNKPFLEEEVENFKTDIKMIRSKYLGTFGRFLFATDWPLCDMKEYLKACQNLLLNEEEKNLFFWKNAVNLFQLSV